MLPAHSSVNIKQKILKKFAKTKRNDSLPDIREKLNSSTIIQQSEPLIKKETPKNENYGTMLLQRIAQKKANDNTQNSTKVINGIVEKQQSPVNMLKNSDDSHPYGNIMLANSYKNKMKTPINFVDNISIQGVEQLKFFKRLDKQIERQKKLYDFYVSSGGNPLQKDEEMRQRYTLDPYRPLN